MSTGTPDKYAEDFTQPLIMAKGPVHPKHRATKEYVDRIMWAPVDVAATGNVEVVFAGDIGTTSALIVDGVTLSLGMRLLLWKQYNPEDNGIYDVTAVEETAVTIVRAWDDAAPYRRKLKEVFVNQGATLRGELLTNVGSYGGMLLFQKMAPAGEALVLYVNGDAGDDNNDGLTVLTPKRTLDAAFAAVPGPLMYSSIQINLTGNVICGNLPVNPFPDWGTYTLKLMLSGDGSANMTITSLQLHKTAMARAELSGFNAIVADDVAAGAAAIIFDGVTYHLSNMRCHDDGGRIPFYFFGAGSSGSCGENFIATGLPKHVWLAQDHAHMNAYGPVTLRDGYFEVPFVSTDFSILKFGQIPSLEADCTRLFDASNHATVTFPDTVVFQDLRIKCWNSPHLYGGSTTNLFYPGAKEPQPIKKMTVYFDAVAGNDRNDGRFQATPLQTPGFMFDFLKSMCIDLGGELEMVFVTPGNYDVDWSWANIGALGLVGLNKLTVRGMVNAGIILNMVDVGGFLGWSKEINDVIISGMTLKCGFNSSNPIFDVTATARLSLNTVTLQRPLGANGERGHGISVRGGCNVNMTDVTITGDGFESGVYVTDGSVLSGHGTVTATDAAFSSTGAMVHADRMSNVTLYGHARENTTGNAIVASAGSRVYVAGTKTSWLNGAPSWNDNSSIFTGFDGE